jgi:hypothetical protein
MSPDGDAMAALRRAGARAVYHLLRAGVEGLKAVEAVIDELGTIGKDEAGGEPGGEPAGGRTRIDLE